MNAYELKQENRRERLERAAQRATSESDSSFRAAHAAIEGIPFGQPILVGHHSEKGHRRALDRSDRGMRKGIEAAERARELASRAAAVGSGGISSDDPDAAAKLGEKVADLEAKRARMKAINVHWRKHQTFDGLALTDAEQRAIVSNVCYAPGNQVARIPFPSYALTNLGACIRSAKQRHLEMQERARAVEAVEAEGAAPTVETINGATVTADVVENRVLLAFPARLSRDGYKRVRSYGFVWSPTRSAFVRKLNGGALEAAKSLLNQGVS